MDEAKMTDADMAQREKIVKSMKKNFKDFRSRYGARAKEVMYATATKMAMKEEETIDEALFYNPSPSHSPKAKNPKEKMSKELRKKMNYFRKKYGAEAKPKMAMKEEETIEENKYSLPAGSMKPEKPVKAKSYLEKRFGHLKPGQSASLKGDPKQVKKTNEEAIEEGEVKKANKEKKNKYVASIIQKKLHPSVLPSKAYGRRKLKEAVKDEADKGEYDYEGDMAKSSLRTIIRNAQMMHDMLDENTNLPEWVASKITLAEDYLVSAAQYMQSEMSEEVEQVDEISKELAWKAAEKASKKAHTWAAAAITGKDPYKSKFEKAVRQHNKITAYASAKTPKVPFVQHKEEVEPVLEYQRGLWRPQEAGMKKSGHEKGKGVVTTYHYKKKNSNTPTGATMTMGGVNLHLGSSKPAKKK
jgi:hypothetical protein